MSDGERKYGFFRCKKDGKEWESSHVYTDQKSGQAYEQDCSDCKTPNRPYKVERMKCSVCGNEDCTCSKEQKEERHVDPAKPHRADLCHKCQSGKPC